ncbi:MAG: hypothetical protein LUG14_08100 [Synergistaceae bacterium]|nr:hypothetical protein [Synergistaceae bacterium]
MDNGKRLAIQFLHPGREKTEEMIIKKADGKLCRLHGRKFVKDCGDYITDSLVSGEENAQIMFWCEYEQQLKYNKLCGRPHIDGYPRYIQTLRPACYRQSCGEIAGCINTDPYIFGRYMLYSNCRQKRSPLLRNLLPGSVIVFGSRVNGLFCFDTVFVVSRPLCTFTRRDGREVLGKLKDEGAISENFWQATVEPLLNDGNAEGGEYVLYESATDQNPIDGMYSFFPCKPLDDIGFPRPAATASCINHKMWTGIRTLVSNENVKGCLNVWKSLRRDVLEKGLCLGVRAKEPGE